MPPETSIYLSQCPNFPTAYFFRVNLVQAIQEHCVHALAPPNVTEVLIQALLEDWCNRVAPLQTPPTPITAHRLIAHQNEIRWDAWIRGFVSYCWFQFVRHEDEHKYSTPFKAATFLQKLQHLIWFHLNKLWEHYLQDIHDQELAPCSNRLSNYRPKSDPYITIQATHSHPLLTLLPQ